VAFRAGVFNIGGEGQLVMGGLGAAVAGALVPGALAKVWPGMEAALARPMGELTAGAVVAKVTLSTAFIVATLAVAALFAALWAALPGALRAYLGVSEVITTIMMNFVAALTVSYLLAGLLKAPGAIPQSPPVSALARLVTLADLVGASGTQGLAATRLNLGFLLAIVVALALEYLLARTTLGFELRLVGANAEAARAQGVPVRRRMVQAMMISGALAGLGGAEQVLGVFGFLVKDFWIGLGFTGIAVALLARNDPVGVLASALLFGALQNAAIEIDMMTGFPRELIIVLQALIIFLAAAAPLVERRWLARTSRR
jgi:simple sugar transport system permease protein